MKKITFLFFVLINTLIFSANNPFLGKWITEKADNGNQIIVEIYEKDQKVFGKITELTLPVYEKDHKLAGQKKMDLNNPNQELSTRTLEGIDFVSNFSFNEKKNRLVKGNIYNPENGKTYHCTISIKNDNQIVVKGSIDKAGLVGKKQIWTKY